MVFPFFFFSKVCVLSRRTWGSFWLVDWWVGTVDNGMSPSTLWMLPGWNDHISATWRARGCHFGAERFGRFRRSPHFGAILSSGGLPHAGCPPFAVQLAGGSNSNSYKQNRIIWKKCYNMNFLYSKRKHPGGGSNIFQLLGLPEVYMCSLRIRWSYFFLCLGKTWKVLSWYRFRRQELRFKFPRVSGTLEMMLTAFGYGNVEWPESGITKDPAAWKKLKAFHSCNFRRILVKYSMVHAEVTCME